MNRRVWCGSLATTAAWVGFASAQVPPSAAPAGSSAAADGPVFVMKTAGQPERRVKVIKSEKLPDGTYLTDVKDLASGVVYTLTNPAVLGTPAANTPAKPEAVAAAPAATTGTVVPAANTPRPIFGSFPNQQQPAAKTSAPKLNPVAANAPRPIFGSFPNQQQPPTPGLRTAAGERLVPADSALPADGLPQARTRKADPLLAGASTSPAAITARTPFVAIPPGSPPSVLGKILGDPSSQDHPPPQPRVGVTPQPAATAVAQENLGAPPTMLPPPSQVAARPTPAPVVVATVPKPAEKVATTEGLAIPSIDRNAKPTAATGIFDSQPATTVQASGVEPPPAVALPPIDPAAAAPERVIPPIVEQPAPQQQPAPVTPPAVDPPAIVVPTAVPAAVVPTPPVEPAPKPAPPPVAAVEVPAVEAAKPVLNGTLPADVQAMLEGLKTHRRPSYRMENATSLGESAYVKHPDVLAGLMQAARTDATGVVRGHCIAQLADAGYSDATFLQLLDTWANDSEPAVRRAAAAAKTKLTGR